MHFKRNKKPVSNDRVEKLNKWCYLKKIYIRGKKNSFKYFIGCINETDAFPVPLYIKHPQINVYVKYFNDDKYFSE